MRDVLRKHHISFQHAWEGLIWALTSQPNFRVHFFLSLLALFGAWFFQFSSIEYLLIIFTIVLGLTVEMLNTAIESMTDLITTEYKQQAKIAKDVAAGMMLMVAIGAIVVAGVLFVPHMTSLVSY